MSHAEHKASPTRTVGAACAPLLVQRRSQVLPVFQHFSFSAFSCVGRTAPLAKLFGVARVSVEEHMDYRAARARHFKS